MESTISYSFFFYSKVQHSSVLRWTHITYRLSPLEYSFPVREKHKTYWLKKHFKTAPSQFVHVFFLFVLTQLWQEALVSWNNIIVQWEPALNDAMDETTNGKPAHSQTPPCPQPAGGTCLAGGQPGHKQKHPRHRKQEHQNLWHRSVIGDIGGNQKVPWPVGMKNSSCWFGIHHLSRERMVNTL